VLAHALLVQPRPYARVQPSENRVRHEHPP
jgi:hypothetical protein